MDAGFHSLHFFPPSRHLVKPLGWVYVYVCCVFSLMGHVPSPQLPRQHPSLWGWTFSLMSQAWVAPPKQLNSVQLLRVVNKQSLIACYCWLSTRCKRSAPPHRRGPQTDMNLTSCSLPGPAHPPTSAPTIVPEACRERSVFTKGNRGKDQCGLCLPILSSRKYHCGSKQAGLPAHGTL